MQNNLKQLGVVIVALIAMFTSGFLLLKYFYPADSKQSISEDMAEDVTGIGPDDELPVIESVLNYKSNVTLEAIKNSTYMLQGSIEAQFTDGKFKGVTTQNSAVGSEISLYDFGDLNGDGSGDALVVTVTNVGQTKYSEIHAVINDRGQTKTVVLSPMMDIGHKIADYSHISISDRKIALEMNIVAPDDLPCCPTLHKAEVYIFEAGKLLVDSRKSVWKKYANSEFGFELSYPEGLPLQVRPIIENGKDISGTLRLLVTVPFTTNYNTWNLKTFTIYSKPGACPYRHEAEIIMKNNTAWHLYDPLHTVTSGPEKNLRMREYMAYKGKHCYTALLAIEGPGPLSADFPKEAEARSPDNLENFFGLEFINLIQVFDSFNFI